MANPTVARPVISASLNLEDAEENLITTLDMSCRPASLKDS